MKWKKNIIQVFNDIEMEEKCTYTQMATQKKISITHIHNTQTLKTVFIMEKRRK